MGEFTHFTADGASRIVDVGDKAVTRRMARAEGFVLMKPETLRSLQERKFAKGDVLEVARLAGIMATKRTSDLIPLCHVLPLEKVNVDFSFEGTQVRVEVSVSTCLLYTSPLNVVGKVGQVDISVRVQGGGTTGQAGAIILGVARALQGMNPAWHHLLADAGLLTRDDRMVERKKYGRKKARKSFQFSKR